MPKYLKANVSVTGNNHGPIIMDMKILCSTCSTEQDYIQEAEQHGCEHIIVCERARVYFIRCARRHFKKEGYLSMKYKPRQDSVPPYRLNIVLSTEKHDQNT